MTIRVTASAPGKPLRHVWSACVGAGRANEGLRAAWQQQLRRAVGECGFGYLRFHGLFHDDMFVYREDKAGNPVYNWQYLDALFDTMLEIGIRPFLELGFSPRAMASKLETAFWWKSHGSPPKDAAKWGAFVSAFASHCLSRYGRDEIRRWYFEVWNEPNLGPFFSGTKTQYFELYRTTAQAIKAADPALRVGGPATSNFVPDSRFDGETEDFAIGTATLQKDPDSIAWRPVWVEQFLRWCAQRQVPVDFVSTHPYPTDFALDGHGEYQGVSRKREATVEDMRLLREIVRRSPYPNAEIHCTEWSSSPTPRDHTHDFPQAATYVAMTNLEGAAAVDSLSYWVFTDIFEESGAGDAIWHGGFGMINFQGLPKPVFHAYRFLHQLGVETISQDHGHIVTRHADGRITALLYHYPREMRATVPIARTADEAWTTLKLGSPKQVQLAIEGLPAKTTFAVETLDADSGWTRGAWERMGCPEPPSREQIANLQKASQPSMNHLETSKPGTLDTTFTLKPWAVVLINQISK